MAGFRSCSMLILAFAMWPAVASATTPLCSWQQEPRADPQAIVDVDKVWAGARVDFAAVQDGKHYVAGYYDQERWLTIARIDTTSHEVLRQRLPTRFAGWDSHNSVALAVDRNGLLHVAANMHAEQLNYFRSTAPGQPLARVSMTNNDDDLVTYPQFVTTSDGDLLFFYRAGRSGDGVWKINRWNGERWTSLSREPFLSNRGFGRSVSGYPSRFTVAADGYIHLAIVWRLTTDAATNVRLSYAKTRDFVRWFDSRNQPLKFPISAEAAETVLHTGPNAGLLNNAKVSLDPRGRPVIVFTRQDAMGRNTVEFAAADGGQWRFVLAETSDRGVDVKGTGSLPNTVALSEVDFSKPDRPAVYYRFPGTAGVRDVLDPATLAPACIEKVASEATSKLAERPIPTMRPQALTIDREAALIWSAQPANQDRAPPCTDLAPLACKPPPSTLKLLIGAKQAAGAP